MTRISICRRFLARAVLALLLPAAAYSSFAQVVIPGLIPKPNLSAYASFPVNVTPDFSSTTGPVLVGYSLGGYLQSPRYIGAEIRGSIQRRLNPQHQESALAGPRFAMRFGNFTPYVSYLMGAGNAWRFRDPPIPGERLPKPVEYRGFQWTLASGADFHLNNRFSVRVGEISVSRIYLKEWNLTPVNFTAGLVYRINATRVYRER